MCTQSLPTKINIGFDPHLLCFLFSIELRTWAHPGKTANRVITAIPACPFSRTGVISPLSKNHSSEMGSWVYKCADIISLILLDWPVIG